MLRKKRKNARRPGGSVKMGLFLVELVRATNDGELPVNQKEIGKRVKKKHRVNITPQESTEYVRTLRSGTPNRIWLRADDGHHPIFLFSEEETISNSTAVEALFIAFELRDTDDVADFDRWVAECCARCRYTENMCEDFVREYWDCGYAEITLQGEEKKLKLNLRTFNQDSFYLEQAREANLKRRPA